MADEPQVIELCIPGEFGYEKMALKLFEAAAEKIGFACGEAIDLEVSKACRNAIELARQLDTDRRALVLLSISANRLRIDVKDEGRGDPPPDHFREPDISRKVADLETLRQMDIHIVHGPADETGFVEPEKGGRDLFRMVIYVRKNDQTTVTPAGQCDCH